ncbi:RIP metalloprotease RseP [Synechococcus sp. RSCCF101]|uniref:RIP metalloprotease RseP n=1 Tax=Synechococcus sp. RSCCF101 TaxID=2511069 RepID=UPI001245345F|nr:RIP metalloprotease RseP [Synechococcus sp. RSCCF101]QEY33208.1 RIP metalloprotease RseP [Synechococcus sp. RSCCF101]
MGVITTLAILAGLIVIHEAGHFFAATAQGIRVSGFSIGFGPALLSLRRGEVTYALRAIPLGGFVSFPDDDEGIDRSDPDLLRNRPLPQRALVIAAGVLANLLLAWTVLLAQGALAGLPAEPAPGVSVLMVQPGEAAAAAGLKPGDTILSVEGQSLGGGQGAVSSLVRRIKTAPGEPLTLSVRRGDAIAPVTLQPSDSAGIGRVGAQLQANGSLALRPARGPIEVLDHANRTTVQLLKRTAQGYGSLLTRFQETASQVSGPVRIVEMGASLASQGGGGLVLFAALISVNLAVLNALPLPLLDGGQMALLLLEGLRGRPLPERVQIAFMQSGVLLLLGLSAVLVVRDTSQLSVVQQLMGR